MVYLMTHPGTPCLFYDDLLDAKKKAVMEMLIEVRQTAGIHCRSKVGFSLFRLVQPVNVGGSRDLSDRIL